ncbi:MAG: alpha/beta hydrolase [Deltaproteobacteria bacterium]|nr:alpha/beta hydrolase [Deltaproteobacteria bacterium]
MIPARDPRYFGPTDRPLFGWIHRAPAPPHLGLVVCNPFGYEAVCAHRSLRHLAKQAADIGVPAIRFDYDGTGDSCGDALEPARVAAWVASIHAAVDELRKATGVAKVVIAGVRLGATLAATAAATRKDVVGVIAIAPVIAGKPYLRELRALQMAAGFGEPPAGQGLPADVVQESLGFPITAETQAAMQALDLLKSERPAAQMLVIDRDDMPANDKWVARLREQGATVQHDRLPGYVEMMLDPHKTTVPERMIDTVTVWLEARAASEPAAHHTNVAGRHQAFLGKVVESPLYLDPDHGQFGILTEPAGPAPLRRKAIILLNAGAVHHVGPNRLYVELARRWAALGHAVLRVDIAGIGDSKPRPGRPENIVYTKDAVDDVAGAVAAVAKLPGVVEVHSVGLCSGAYNSIKAASRGLRLRSIVPINPLTFTWHDPMPLDYPAFKVAGEAKRYQEAAFSVAKWKKLLRGEVNVQAVAQVMARRGYSLARHKVRDLARLARRPFPDDVGAELEQIARAGVGIHFVFAERDPGQELLRVEGGTAAAKLIAKGQIGVATIDGPDHTFTPVWSHAALIDRLGAILDAPVS